MSFGTGHHQTTYLMIRAQMKMDHRDKRVMDAGCGTAILSVMASKLGAREVEAFDIDEWSVTNSQDNIELNHCKNIRHQLGKLSELPFEGTFDIILANINKNVLLDEMPLYAALSGTGRTTSAERILYRRYSPDLVDRCRTACALYTRRFAPIKEEQLGSRCYCSNS